MQSTETLAGRLVDTIAQYGTCVVAFSAGVDSTIVAKAAALALGENATAVTAVSPSLASGELEEAQEIAKLIGIRHQVIHTDEVSKVDYQKNGHDRCYHCKTELYDHLETIAATFPNCVVVNGTNTDDLGDYRPGLIAAEEHHVRSPMVECEINKDQVRAIAAFWELPVWNKPAMPCLSSRIAYGVEVTPERLRMIDRAEKVVREHGFRELRVRYHDGDLARIEVATEDVSRLTEATLRNEIASQLKAIGFRFVTIDMEGFRSGNFNTLIPIEVLQQKKS